MNKLAKYCQTGGLPDRYKKMGFDRANQVKNAPQGDSHKKMVVAKKGDDYKLVKFGYRGMEDYIQHKDEDRRKNYLARSGGIKNKSGKLTKDDVFSANHWARKILWQTGGEGNGVIAEAGEFYKDENGQIQQINPNTVSHDDYILIDEQGNPISKMPYNQGGVAVNGVQNVLSASHENRESDDKSYKQADEDIRIKPKEGKEFAKRFNFGNIKFNGGSPSKLFDSVLEAKTNKLKKYNNIEYNKNSPYGINSSKANGAYVEALPQDEMIYDEIFNYQESKKQESDIKDTMQTGGNTLYVDSKNDPRYKAYQDSLNLYNSNNNSKKLYKNFKFIKQGKYVPYNNLKKELIKNYGKTDPNLSQQPSGIINYGKFNYNKTKDAEWGQWENQNTYSEFLNKKLKNKPIGFMEELEKNFPNQPNYNAIYKKPIQPVKVLQRNKINNLNQLQSIPYQQQEVEYNYPEINFTPIQEQKFYNPERVIGSEYNQNSDASYGKFQRKKSDYYDKQLQKMNQQTGGGIKINPEKKGTFKAAATRYGMSMDNLAMDAKNNPDKYSSVLKKKANFYRNFAMQQGGKGTLSPYPEMYGNKPVAMVNIKGKLYPASTVNGRTVSMDDVFNKRDSVELKNFKAIKLNKNERIKK